MKENKINTDTNTRTSPAGHGGAEVESYFPNLILPNQFYPNFISPLKISYSAPKFESQETLLTSSQNVLTTSDQLSMHPGTISGRQNEPNCNFRTSIFLILIISVIGNAPGSPTCRGSTLIKFLICALWTVVIARKIFRRSRVSAQSPSRTPNSLANLIY